VLDNGFMFDDIFWNNAELSEFKDGFYDLEFRPHSATIILYNNEMNE